MHRFFIQLYTCIAGICLTHGCWGIENSAVAEDKSAPQAGEKPAAAAEVKPPSQAKNAENATPEKVPENADKKADAKPADFSLPDLVKKIKPALVTIERLDRNGNSAGIGSGFIIDPNGLIVTNAHVIGEGRNLKIHNSKGENWPVKTIEALDRIHDLAILRVDAKDLPALPLAKNAVEQGQSIIAFGNPLGFEFSVVEGVVSAIREFDGIGAIQIAMPVEKGNSGGPLLNQLGQVLGVVSMKSVVTENLAFATPISDLQKLQQKIQPIDMALWVRLGKLDEARWQAPSGADWTRKAGMISVQGRGAAFGGRTVLIEQKEPQEFPYEISVNVRCKESDGAAGLVFDARDNDHHFGFYWTDGKIRFTHFDGPEVFTWSILHESAPPNADAEWQRLTLHIEKDKITAFANGEKMYEYAHEAKGKPGLCQFRGTQADFRSYYFGKIRPQGKLEQALEATISDLFSSDQAFTNEQLAQILNADSRQVDTLLENKIASLESSIERLKQADTRIRSARAAQQITAIFEEKEENFPLCRASLHIAAIDHHVDTEAILAELESMQNDIKSSLAKDASAEAIVEATSRYLFDIHGIRGSHSDYENPANSHVDRLIEDKEGLPITIAILFIDLCHANGAKNVYGLPLPGHFCVAYPLPKDQAIEKLYPNVLGHRVLDVFDNGKALTQDEVAAIIYSDNGLDITKEDLKPASQRQIVSRMLRNLVQPAMQENPASTMPWLYLLTKLEPDSLEDRFSYGLILAAQKSYNDARVELTWVLENDATPELLKEKIASILDRLPQE